jgi:exosortase
MEHVGKTVEIVGVPEDGRRKPYAMTVGLVLMCVVPMALAWDSMHALFALAFKDDTYSHIPLIPLVSLFLIYVERRSIFRETTYDWRMGSAVFVPGAVVVLLAQLNFWQFSSSNQLSLLVFGVVLMWVGAFVSFFGARAFRSAIFPLLFLLFAIPIPAPLLSKTIHLLQYGSADAAGAIFNLVGVQSQRHDLVFVLPGVAIQVAEECSGIRSTLALLITAVLAGHFFLKSKVRVLILCALALPIAIIKNGMRIATLSLLAVYVNPGYLYGNLHHYAGIPFFLVDFVILGPVLLLLRHGEGRRDFAKRRASAVVA